MLCFQCGSSVANGVSACPNCGANLEKKRQTRTKKAPESDTFRKFTSRLKAVPREKPFFLEGEVLADRFDMGEVLGRGPFGQVFRAQDREIDADVAVKVLAKEVFRDPREQERFTQVMRDARTRSHANLVRVHDSGVHGDHPWISMQRLEGLSLRQLMKLRASKGERFEVEEVQRLFSGVVDALQHLGDRAHGDLNPENLLVLSETIKVTDEFLFAALAPDVIATRAGDGLYIAPEVRRAEEFDARADVYSLGVIVTELFFGGVELPEAPPEEWAEVARVCERARSRTPGERYATPGHFLDALSGKKAAVVPPAPPMKAPPAAPPAPPAAPATIPPAPPEAPEEVTPEAVEEVVEEVEDAEVLAELPSDPQMEVETIEISRAPTPPPELGDLLPTNEVDRALLDAMPRTDADSSSEQTVSMLAPAPEVPAEEGGGSNLRTILPIVGFVAVLVGIAVVMNMTKEKAPESLTTSTSVTKTTATPVAPKPEVKKPDTPKPTTPDPKVATTAASKEVKDGVEVAHKALPETKTPDPAKVEPPKTPEPAAVVAPVKKDPPKVEPEKKDPPKVEPEKKDPPKADPPKEEPKKDPKVETPPEERTPSPTGTKCPKGMALLKGKTSNLCVDRYEYPGRGAKPRVNVSWFDAKKLCEGRGKRLCSLSEWRRACGSKYPYGKSWNADKCNTADEDEFPRKIARAGSSKGCRRRGLYDMSGNVFEWVAEKRVAGGSFQSGEDQASCRYASPKTPGSRGGDVGFRCCAMPE